MAALSQCIMCAASANETDEGKLFVCASPNCLHANKKLCATCGITSHRNHSKYDHEFGGRRRTDMQVQSIFETAAIAQITSTSNTNHGTKKVIGNSGLIVYAVFEAGKNVLKESGKKYTAKQLFEAGAKELSKNGSKSVIKGLSKGAAGLQVAFCVWECCVEVNRFNKGIISGKELQRLITRSVTANSVTLGGAAGGAVIGFSVAGPPGAFVGGVIGGVAADLGTRFVFDRWIWSNEEQKDREHDIKEALALFQYIGVRLNDIWRENTFNDKILKGRYHRLALDNHPDRPNGSVYKFEIVMKSYNILLGVLKEKERRSKK